MAGSIGCNSRTEILDREFFFGLLEEAVVSQSRAECIWKIGSMLMDGFAQHDTSDAKTTIPI